MRSRTLIQSYQRAKLLRRVMLGVFCFTFGAIILWAIPWVGWGLTVDDYNSGATVPVALALGAWLSAAGAVYLRDKSNRYEQTLVTWSSVRDELGDLRRREYFFERVIIECTRSERSNVPFAVLSVRFGSNDEARSVDVAMALEAIGGLVRQTDTLAALGPQELGVLGIGMGNREAPAFAYRVKGMLENAISSSDPVNVGWAIWGSEGKDAGTLVGIARSRMQRKATTRELGMQITSPTEAPANDEFGDESLGNGAMAAPAPSPSLHDKPAA